MSLVAKVESFIFLKYLLYMYYYSIINIVASAPRICVRHKKCVLLEPPLNSVFHQVFNDESRVSASCCSVGSVGTVVTPLSFLIGVFVA